MFILYAKKNILEVTQKETVTSGSVNVYTVQFNFNEDWNGLVKTAVFKVGNNSAAVLLDDTNECTIPWEVLDSPMRPLEIGVYGTKDAEIVLPTIWANAGEVKQGTIVRESAIEPTPSLMEQLLDAVNKKGDNLDYDGFDLKLLSGETVISSIPLIGGTGGDVVTGVTAFNGRRGNVTPQAGDYTAEMVGALPADTVIPSTAEQVGADPVGTAEEKVAALKNELVPQIEDKISASGDVMSGPLQFSAGTTETVTRSGVPTGEISMETDGLHLQSSTNAINVNNSVLRGVASGVENNDVTTVEQLESAVTALETSISEIELTPGPVGPAGPAGAKGPVYLVYNEDRMNPPTTGSTQVMIEYFNRRPKSDEPFSGIITNNGITYYVTGDVGTVSDDAISCVGHFKKVTRLTGEDGGAANVSPYLYAMADFPSDDNTNAMGTNTILRDNISGRTPIVGAGGTIFFNQGSHLYYNRFEVTALYDTTVDIKFTSNKVQIDTPQDISIDIGRMIITQKFLPDNMDSDVGGTCSLSKNDTIGNDPKVDQQGIAFIHQHNHLYYNRFKVTEPYDENGFGTIQFISKKTQIDTDTAPGILLYGSVADSIVKNQSTTVAENFFIGPLPQVDDAGYGLLEQGGKLYRVAYHVSSISPTNLFTIVYDDDPVLIGPSAGSGNLSDAPLGIAVTEHIPKKDDYINFPMENIFGALPTAGGPFTAIVFSTEGVSKCSCKVSDSYKPGYWAATTQVQFAESIDLTNYYTKSEVDGKIADYLLCYSAYPPTVEIANGGTKSILTEYFIGATPIADSLGIMIYSQGDNQYLIRFKVLTAETEVADVQFMSDPVQINTPDMAQYYNKSEVDEKIQTIELTPGPTGASGTDGITPHIGDNGNWFIGDTDTGIAATGPAGADGTNGVSPTITTAPNANSDGTTVTITDVNGPHTFDILNGLNGEDGVGVPTGGTTGQVLAKSSDEDYATQWVDVTQNGGSVAAYLVNAPIGVIMGWSGTEENVPEGWSVCNGENGTLDLRDKFILGAGLNHSVGDTGGSEEVTLTNNEMPSHAHTISLYNPDMSQGMARNIIYTGDYLEESVKFKVESNKKNYSVDVSTQTGGSQPHPNMPPYYTLLFIQKTSETPTDYVTEEKLETAIQEAISAIPAGSNVPTGGIIIWSGASNAVPDGWALCDGTNNTPDLRGRFVLGESVTHSAGETGGIEEVTLTIAQMPSHVHNPLVHKNSAIGSNNTLLTSNGSGTFDVIEGTIQSNGSSQPHPNMPPYYVLAYIMKL